jgi:ubiquinone/menaquinone biosynthesis C-methylase UbiE
LVKLISIFRGAEKSMISTKNNKEVYSTIEFDTYANRENLNVSEKYLIGKFLNKNEKTLEAGTGGGRILLEMRGLGFTSLYGFDYVPELIERAKQKDRSQSICFEVQDATNLNYQSCYFDQILYLDQIISSIEDEGNRLQTFKEAYRILKTGGTALFSFLSFEARSSSLFYVPYLVYLSLIRKLRGSNRSLQYLPWLKHGGKINWSALIDAEPYVYWYKTKEVDQILKEIGFEVVAIGSKTQMEQEKMHSSVETLVNEPITGMLTFVCKK